MGDDIILREFPDLANSRIPALFGGPGSGSTEIVGLYAASQVDDEQDGVLPNLSRNPVLGPLQPGSTHGLWFGNRAVDGVVEPALLLDQRTVASRVNAPAPALSSSTQWTITAKIDPASTGASRRVFYCSKPGGVLDTEKLYYFDGTTLHTASSTVQTLLGTSQGTPFWARWKVAGTSLTIDCSSDGSTWVNALTGTLAASIALTGTLDLGSSSTTDGFRGWFYSLQVRDGDESSPVVAHWTPDLHPAGSRADSDTATDPAGTVWTITRPSTADSNDPTRIAHDGTNKIWLPGTSSNYLSVPDSAANSISGDIDIRWFGTPDDFAPSSAGNCASKWQGPSEKSWRLRATPSGAAVLDWTEDGSTAKSASSTVAWTEGHLRATLDVDDGAGNHVVKFWTSLDGGVTWTQLGSDVTGSGTTSVWPGASVVEVASQNSGTGDMLTCTFERLEVRDGIDGSIASRIAASDASDGSETSWTDSVTGETVTVSRGTSGASTTVVVEDVVITNGSTFLEAIWDTALEIQAGESLTVVIVERHWFASNWGRFVAFSNTVSPYKGWMLLNDGTLASKYLHTEGATQVLLGRSLAEVVYGARQVTEATIDGSSGEMWADGSTVQEISYGADVPVTQPDRNSLTVAAHPGSALDMTMEFFALAILKGTARITDDEATAHYQELSS